MSFKHVKDKSLAQTDLTHEVFIASTFKSETANFFTRTKSHQGGHKQIATRPPRLSESDGGQVTEIQNSKQIE